MIINIKNKKDLITLDLRIKQIRYLYGEGEKVGYFKFIPLSSADVDGYEYLLKNDITTFKLTIIKELYDFLDLKINIKDLEFLK